MLQLPPEAATALDALDCRSDVFTCHEADRALRAAVPDPDILPEGQLRALRAVRLAIGGYPMRAFDSPHWVKYYRPRFVAEADADTMEYLSGRARAVRHPLLVARFSDLVWSTAKDVLNTKPAITFAHSAIDGYLSAAERDDGTARFDIDEHLRRAIRLGRSIGDTGRVDRVAEGSLAYVGRTFDPTKIGTYLWLERLVEDGRLDHGSEAGIIAFLEEQFAAMTVPGGPWDYKPIGPRQVGVKLAKYYERRKLPTDRARVLREVGGALARHASLLKGAARLHFLHDSHEFHLMIGDSRRADELRREMEEVMPEVIADLVPMEVSIPVDRDHQQRFLAWFTEAGKREGMLRFAVGFLPRQSLILDMAEQHQREAPLSAMFPPTLLGNLGTFSDVGDSRGDAEGSLVHATAQFADILGANMHRALDALRASGIGPADVVQFANESPLFLETRSTILHRGLEAYFAGDYLVAIHLLVPQIERALIEALAHVGRSRVKPHRSGRAVLQSKSINDALDDSKVKSLLGDDLRMYLVATLSHPKGMNIRNCVCHGLWEAKSFNRTNAERLVHVLLSLAIIRERATKEQQVGAKVAAQPSADIA